MAYLTCARWKCVSWAGDGQVSCTEAGQPYDWRVPQVPSGEVRWPTRPQKYCYHKDERSLCNDKYKIQHKTDDRERWCRTRDKETSNRPPYWTHCWCSVRWVQSRWVWTFSRSGWQVASSCSAPVSRPVRSEPWSPRLATQSGNALHQSTSCGMCQFEVL